MGENNTPTTLKGCGVIKIVVWGLDVITVSKLGVFLCVMLVHVFTESIVNNNKISCTCGHVFQ